MNKYKELIAEWAKEQGFETWAKDHKSVLRNLTSWLESRNERDRWICTCDVFEDTPCPAHGNFASGKIKTKEN